MCPHGGTQLTMGATTTYVCNGAPGPGGSVTWRRRRPAVTFAGYTLQTYTGNLNGRSGRSCALQRGLRGQPFRELGARPVQPPPVAVSAWWLGNSDPNSRNFRLTYSSTDSDNHGADPRTCVGQAGRPQHGLHGLRSPCWASSRAASSPTMTAAARSRASSPVARAAPLCDSWPSRLSVSGGNLGGRARRACDLATRLHREPFRANWESNT